MSNSAPKLEPFCPTPGHSLATSRSLGLVTEEPRDITQQQLINTGVSGLPPSNIFYFHSHNYC